MKNFSQTNNYDDILLRSVIVSLLKELNDKIYLENKRSAEEKEIVHVPFYYNFSGDERFMQDYFQEWSDCAPLFIEGNYDPVPRGSITLKDLAILSGQQTSRFIRAKFNEIENGTIKAQSSYLNSIPLGMPFDTEIIVDTMTDALKITQQLIKVFYKTITFFANFEGSLVPCQAGFSESYSNDKLAEYTYGETKKITIRFTLEVETYLPIFDPLQKMFAGDTIGKSQINFTTLPSSISTEIDDDIPSNLKEGYYE